MKHVPAILSLLLALAAPVAAQAQKADVGQVDAILDRLERRLLDQEADGLTYGEKTAPLPSMSDKTPVTQYKFQKDVIEGAPEGGDRLKDVARLVTELESQVDTLASSVSKVKQGILDEASIDNFVSLEASLPDTDAAAIKSIVVKLDGFKLYEIDDAAGLWLPSQAIPLYAGPLQPGNHRIDLEARIVVRQAKAMPLTGAVYRFVNKSFQWAVPGGTTTSRYVLTILPPDKLDGVADAKLTEAM